MKKDTVYSVFPAGRIFLVVGCCAVVRLGDDFEDPRDEKRNSAENQRFLARRWKESLRHQRDSFTIFSRPTCIQLPFRFYDLPLAHGLPFFFLLFATLQPTDSGFPSGRWERQVEDHAHRRILFRCCRDSFARLCLDELVALAMSSYRCDIGQGIIPTRYVSLEFITTKLVMLLTTVLSKFLYYTYKCVSYTYEVVSLVSICIGTIDARSYLRYNSAKRIENVYRNVKNGFNLHLRAT